MTDITEFIRSATLVLAFLLLVFWDSRIWMKADAMASFGFGLALVIFPKQLSDIQVEGELDALHLQLTQLLGVIILSQAVFWYFVRYTRDATVHISLLLWKIFSCGLLLLAMVHSHWLTTRGKKNIKWNDQHVTFSMLGVALWLMGNLIHFLRNCEYNTYPQHHTRLNHQLQINSWFYLTIGVFFFSYPEYAINLMYRQKGLDAVHVQLVRLTASLCIGSAIVALQAPGFLHEKDKRSHFLAMLLTEGIVGMLIFGQYLVLDSVNVKGLVNMSVVFSPFLLNMLFGYFGNGTTIYEVDESKLVHTEHEQEKEHQEKTEHQENIEHTDKTEHTD